MVKFNHIYIPEGISDKFVADVSEITRIKLLTT